MEPMGNAVHTALSGPIAGKSVAVIGCGPIGVMAVAVANAAGASQVIALDLERVSARTGPKDGGGCADPLRKAGSCTGDGEVDEERGVDVVLEMSGNATAIRQGFSMLTAGGRISMLGLPTETGGAGCE